MVPVVSTNKNYKRSPLFSSLWVQSAIASGPIMQLDSVVESWEAAWRSCCHVKLMLVTGPLNLIRHLRPLDQSSTRSTFHVMEVTVVKGPMEGRFLSFLLVMSATLESARQTRKRKNKPEPSIKGGATFWVAEVCLVLFLFLLSVRPLKPR